MKTLKFMLAAATAIGLASASQAVGPYDGSTDFEADTLNSTITTSGSYWTVPTGAEDGDYTIVAGNPVSDQVSPAVTRSAGATSAFTDTPSQVLKLEGGTDPLLRNIQATGAAVDLTQGEVYIDTLVQFTVTPASDEVTTNADDKLLIYLKEDLTSGSEATNLMVKAAQYASVVIPTPSVSFTPVDVAINNATVQPNTWYRLQVKSFVTNNFTCFTLALNGVELTSATHLFDSNDGCKLFPSLRGLASTSLTSVGFAGSGAVDDLLFTTFDPAATVLDFYLALNGAVAGIDGSVHYETTAMSGNLSAGTNTVYCYGNSTAVTVTYDTLDGYTASWDVNPNGATITKGAIYTLMVSEVPTGIDFTLTLATGVSSVSFTADGTPYNVTTTTNLQLSAGTVNYNATFDAANWWTGDASGSFTVAAAPGNTYTVTATRENAAGVITSETTPASLGITSGAFAGSAQAELTKVVDWAVANNKTTSDVNAMTFANALSPTANEKSYLLGEGLTGAMTEEAAIAALEIASIEYVDGTGWVIKSQNNKGDGDALANGHIDIFGATTVDGTYTSDQAGKSFFKAVLVK